MKLKYLSLPESKRNATDRICKMLKAKGGKNGTGIAIMRVPVMYRLLENIRPDRKRAGTRQEQPPKKRQTGRGAWIRRGGQTTGRNCWEASDQRRDAKRHSKEWRFVRLGRCCWRRSEMASITLVQMRAGCATCAVFRETVLSNLPIRRLMRTTHNWAEKARR